MGRSIYFTDLEIEKLIDYVSDSVGLDDGSWKETEACSSEEDALKWINTMFGVTE